MQVIKDLYFTTRFFLAMAGMVVLFVLAYLMPFIFPFVVGLFFLLCAFFLFEIITLFRFSKGINGQRILPKKLSNGDYNDIEIHMHNRYPMTVRVEVIDEVPEQFQYRESNWSVQISPKDRDIIHYQLRPVKRGEYHFGKVNAFVSLFAHLIQRRFRLAEDAMVKVYPSFIQMRKYEFAAFTHQLREYGIKKIRRLGHTMEFEQIKEYVKGDDPRTINWKASARTHQLMVNQYQDEKSQPIYCVVDKGRLMRFPFDRLSLLDYAINASLVMSNIAIKKQDKAGLITFSNKLSTVVKAEKKPGHLKKILEALYNQKTNYKESNFELLSQFVNTRINQRSLLICFTNFESLSSFHRQLPYFIHLSKKHLVVVVFFRNRELDDLIHAHPEDMEQIYTQVIAQQYENDKNLITRELSKHGIYSILTYPEDLTVNTINKYLELKAMGVV